MTFLQRWRQTSLYNKLSVVGTVALVVVGIAQVVIYLRQASIMSTQAQIANGQLAETQLEGRAWVSIVSLSR
jgi:hypothetical protein